MIDIDDLLGVPYKDHGRTKDGYDCYGLVLEVMKRMGKQLRDVAYDNHERVLSDIYAPTLNIKKLDAPVYGAIIEMHYNNELHIGVCLSDTEFIHMTKLGCRVSRIGTFFIRGLYGCCDSV